MDLRLWLLAVSRLTVGASTEEDSSGNMALHRHILAGGFLGHYPRPDQCYSAALSDYDDDHC